MKKKELKIPDYESKTVAFQGEKGAYSEIAAEKYFGKKISTSPTYSFEEVFLKVKSGKADYGIIPIENTLYGSVYENYDYLLKYSLPLTGEVVLQINHCLLAPEIFSLNEIKKIYSHPQAIGQCSHFLKKLKAEVVPAYDTAGAIAISLKNKDELSAAIASKKAAGLYKMKILKAGIQNNKENFTRFLIITKDKKNIPELPGAKSKTSVCFDLKSFPGALHKALGVFAGRQIDLVKIESRPIPHKPFTYTFYIDITGNTNEEKVKKALGELSSIAVSIKKLGTYESGRVYSS